MSEITGVRSISLTLGQMHDLMTFFEDIGIGHCEKVYDHICAGLRYEVQLTSGNLYVFECRDLKLAHVDR